MPSFSQVHDSVERAIENDRHGQSLQCTDSSDSFTFVVAVILPHRYVLERCTIGKHIYLLGVFTNAWGAGYTHTCFALGNDILYYYSVGP